MKKILFILMGFMLSMFAPAQKNDNLYKNMPSVNDTLTVRFEKPRMNREEVMVQEQLNTLLTNSVKTTSDLSTNINRLTTVIEEGITLNKLSKADIVAQQLGIKREALNKPFKLNNTLKLISLLPAIVFIFWAMGQLLVLKGLDIKQMLSGTVIMALYALIGSGVLYAALSLIFNRQYFVIKDLMSALF